MDLVPVVEGMLFLVGDEGIAKKELQDILGVNDETINNILSELEEIYNNPKRGLKIELLGNKLKLVTKKEHKEYYERLTDEEINSMLSPAALETLAIIAYNQPVTRVQVDEIRGISSSHLVRKLLLKNLIKELGKSDAPGRPNLYGTTNAFLDYFGLNSIEELPKLNEIEIMDEETNLFESKYKETL